MTRIAVLGAGVVGLSTAVQIQSAVPDSEVSIIAEKFTAETTSDGAAGIFRPTMAKTPGVPKNLIMRWLRDSWAHYDQLAHSPDAGPAGLIILPFFQLYENKTENELEKEIIYNYRPLSSAELSMFPGDKFRVGFHCTTIMTECRRYLPYLMKRFIAANGHVVKRKIESLEELVGKFDLVFNCLGVGARSLLNDTKLYPIRGHLIRIDAPWIKHAIMVGDAECTYIYPGIDNVVVGGTRQEGDMSQTPREDDKERILEEAYKILPSLRKARILWQWVGFRPYRNPLRLETEIMSFRSGKLKVVHNYGHGGEGVSLSWGTAKHAVDLGLDLLQDRSKTSKL